MSLSTAFNIISSSFAANAAQTAVVSNNIANVNTPGYSQARSPTSSTNSYGGVDVASVTRLANAALTEQVSTSTAQAAYAAGDRQRPRDARGDRRRQLHDVVDLRREPERRLAVGDARQSPERADDVPRLADLDVRRGRRGHRRARTSPNRSTQATRRSTRCASRRTRTWPRRSRPSIRCSASSRPPTTPSSADWPPARMSQPPRTRAIPRLTQLAQQIGGVTTSTAANGSMSIYTDSGVTLFQDTARTVSFTPTSTYADGVSGNAVTVDTLTVQAR